ncbi:MAG: helix-turn-helix domain-containing protein [bacterium]
MSETNIHLKDLPREFLSITTQRISLAKDPLQRILESSPADLEDLRSRKKEMERLLAEQERQLIERALKDANGNITEAASKLGVHRVTLHKMLKRAKKK